MSFNKLNQVMIAIATADVAEIRIDPTRNHRSLYARRFFGADELIVEFASKAIYNTPNYLTIQIADDQHIELLPEYLECTNHSCDPNCFFDTTSRRFIATKAIEEGAELTFFYPSTEWEMDRAFQCTCGSKNCIGLIQGAKYLSEQTLKQYRLTEFIEQKLATRC